MKTAANGPGHMQIPLTVATFLSWRGWEACIAWYLLLIEKGGSCTLLMLFILLLTLFLIASFLSNYKMQE